MIQKIISVLLLTLLMLNIVACDKNPNGKNDTDTTAMVAEIKNIDNNPSTLNKEKKIKEKDFLVTSGTKFVNQDGETIVLKGFNLGGWLTHTIYMSPITGDGIVDDTTMLNKLNERFGVERTQALYQVYYDNFFTDIDAEYIKKTGANSVRLPFWWRNFMSEDGEWLETDENGKPTFSLLQKAVDICNQNGLYVILELHGAPGSQNGMHASGVQTDFPTFFANEETSNAEIGEWNRDTTTKLWVAVAEHFKDEPAVAGYDILGEPYWTGTINTENRWWIWKYYDEVYEAIREVDYKHVIIFESSWNVLDLPAPDLKCEWKTNAWIHVAYSPHYYPKKTEKDQAAVLDGFEKRFKSDLNHIKDYDVPLYIGETNYYTDMEMWDYTMKQFAKNGVSYSMWAYKCPMDVSSFWGIVFRGTVKPADVVTMSYTEIEAVWKQRTFKCMQLNVDGVRMVCKHWGGDITAFGLNTTQETENTINVESVALNVKEITLNVGETYQLTATVLPENATNSKLKWLSSNNDVLTVSNTGLVTAKAAGGPVYVVVKCTSNEAIKASVKIAVK